MTKVVSGAMRAIAAAQRKSKLDAIRDRLLRWIERAADAEIVSEAPKMVRESVLTTASMVPHIDDEVTITLVVKGVGLEREEIMMLDIDGKRYDDSNWTIK